MELWRRVFLVFGFLGAVSLFMWVSLKPVFLVDVVDFAEEQENQSQWTERGQYLAQLPLENFISEITKDKILQVEGPAWEAFFDGVTSASTGQPEAGIFSFLHTGLWALCTGRQKISCFQKR